MATGARAAGARTTERANEDTRTPAQWYCLIFGATLLVAGLLGFAFDSTFDTGSNLNGSKLIGIFEVNAIHNLVHVASGILLLALAPKRASAKLAALGFGAVYLVVTIIGIADGSDVLGLIPVNSADNLLHVAISGLAIASGLVSTGDDAARSPVAGRDGDRATVNA
jgi:hypothetical protein